VYCSVCDCSGLSVSLVTWYMLSVYCSVCDCSGLSVSLVTCHVSECHLVYSPMWALVVCQVQWCETMQCLEHEHSQLKASSASDNTKPSLSCMFCVTVSYALQSSTVYENAQNWIWCFLLGRDLLMWVLCMQASSPWLWLGCWFLLAEFHLCCTVWKEFK